MHNERLFYLSGVTKLAPGHIYPTQRAKVLDSIKLCYSECSLTVMVQRNIEESHISEYK